MEAPIEPPIEQPIEPSVINHVRRPESTKHLSSAKESVPTSDSKVFAKKSDVPSFISLRAAMGNNSRKVKGADLDSFQNIPSERVKKARAPPKSALGKSQKPKPLPKSPIEKATASDLELLRKFNPHGPVSMLILFSYQGGSAPCAKPSLWT